MDRQKPNNYTSFGQVDTYNNRQGYQNPNTGSGQTFQSNNGVLFTTPLQSRPPVTSQGCCCNIMWLDQII